MLPAIKVHDHHGRSSEAICLHSVDRLPSRKFLQCKGTYLLRLRVGDREEWMSREVRTRGTRAACEAMEDMDDLPHQIHPTDFVQATVCKRRRSGQMKELGRLVMRAGDWARSTEVDLVHLDMPASPRALNLKLRLLMREEDGSTLSSQTSLR